MLVLLKGIRLKGPCEAERSVVEPIEVPQGQRGGPPEEGSSGGWADSDPTLELSHPPYPPSAGGSSDPATQTSKRVLVSIVIDYLLSVGH